LIPSHKAPSELVSYVLLGRFATPELRRENAQALGRVSAPTLAARLRAVARVDVSKECAQIEVPGLYLRATEDRLVPASAGLHLARRNSRIRIVDIEAPHFMLQVNPQAAARTIVGFVQSVDGMVDRQQVLRSTSVAEQHGGIPKQPHRK
jgi:pimeloyl-[acyl-carrier protein] methyl ester esterase